jgi:hypothetical protein
VATRPSQANKGYQLVGTHGQAHLQADSSGRRKCSVTPQWIIETEILHPEIMYDSFLGFYHIEISMLPSSNRPGNIFDRLERRLGKPNTTRIN